MTNIPQLLRLFQLVSPALPVGAYAYSRGLEWAVQAEWVKDEKETFDWVHDLLCHPLCYLDTPILVRLYRAWENNRPETVERWSQYLHASRESSEFQAEDVQMGRALARLLADLDMPEADRWGSTQHTTFAAMFALAAHSWSVPLEETCAGFLWGWTEGSVAAALKLVPLGQTAGQRILARCSEVIPDVVRIGQTLTDDEIGYVTPGLAIASALHETQHTRLFRS